MPLRPSQALVSLGLVIAALAGPTRADFDNTYSEGHADLGVSFDVVDGFYLHYHIANGAIVNGVPLSSDAEYAPDDVTTIVSDGTLIRPGAAIPFLGNGAGDAVWVLPANEELGVPFFGVGTEDLDPSDAWSAVSFAMTGYSGPGNFALWQNDGMGLPQVRWQSNDGVDGSDSFSLGAGGHAHYFWGFTTPGIYDVTVTATATRDGTGYTDTGTLRFQVGAVPEPSSLALIGLGMGGTLLVGSRLRKRGAGSR